MDTIEEKRVYSDRSGATTAYVASPVGVVRVRVAGDTVGEFDLCDRCEARDIATMGVGADGAVAVATDEDVRLLESGPDGDLTGVETGFGPAIAVGDDGGTLLAADADGRVARRRDGDWEPLASEPIETVTAIDGGLIGTERGVYRVHDGTVDHAGLTDVRDVSVAGIPLAATGDGLYKLGNGWMEIRDEATDLVAADPATDRGRLDRAHAVAGVTMYAHDPDDGWVSIDAPPEPIAGIGYGESVYAVGERGTFFVATMDGPGRWRSQPIGVSGVTGLAVPFEG